MADSSCAAASQASQPPPPLVSMHAHHSSSDIQRIRSHIKKLKRVQEILEKRVNDVNGHIAKLHNIARQIRSLPNAQPVDPANMYSSYTHGVQHVVEAALELADSIEELEATDSGED